MPLLPLPGAMRRSLLLSVVCVLLASLLRAQSGTPSAADGFNPKFTINPTVLGTVNAVAVQSDGKILIGGTYNFVQANGQANPITASGLVRLNADGTLDSTFVIPTLSNPSSFSLGAAVNVLALQPDGKILVGGNFAMTGGGSYLVRLNTNGTLDTTWTPSLSGNVNGAVTAILPYTDKFNNSYILIGGNFTSIQFPASAAVTRNHVARLYQTLQGTAGVEPTWNPNVNAQVDCFAIEPSDGWIQMGGAFTTIGTGTATVPATVRNHLVRVDPTQGLPDAAWDPEADNAVTGIAIEPNGESIIVGSFNTLNPENEDGSYPASPETAAFVAELATDGTLDSNFSTQASAYVQNVIIAPSGQIYLCGSIGTVSGTNVGTTAQSNLARLNADGSPDTTYTPQVNGPVNAMALQTNGQLVIGGLFTQVQSSNAPNGTPRQGMARIDSNGSLDIDFNPSAFGGIGVIAVDASGNYLVGGSFTSINGVTVRNFARLSPSGVVDTTLEPDPDQPVNAIAVQSNGQIILGGSFTQITSGTGQNAAVWPVPSLVRLNTNSTIDFTYAPDPVGSVSCLLLLSSGQLLVGGSFSEFTPENNAGSPVAVSNLARLNSDGSIDTTFEPNPDNKVDNMVIDSTGGAVVVVGNFTSFTPASDEVTTPCSNIGRVSLKDGTIDPNFTPSPDQETTSVALQSNGQLVVGGFFTQFEPRNSPIDPTTLVPYPITRNGVARLNADGTLDLSFDPETDGNVFSVAVNPTNQQIYVGGIFHNINHTYQPYLARLNSDGDIDKTTGASSSTDTGFGVTLNGPVDVVLSLPNNQFLAGGAFTTAVPFGGSTATPASHLLRFNGDGTIDSSLSFTSQMGGQINAFALEPSGQLLVAGSFANIGGSFASNLARFLPDGSFDNTFAADANGPVNAVVVESQGSSIYVGGSFGSIGGNTALRIARLNNDGSLDTSFSNASIGGPVYALAVQANGQVLAGGSFPSADGSTLHVNLVRLNQNGTYDASFVPTVNGEVQAVAVQTDGRILIGGMFTTVNGSASPYLARLNADGSLDTSFSPKVAAASGSNVSTVDAIAIQPDGLILVGGLFSSAGGAANANLARLTAAGAADSTFSIPVNGEVNAIVLENPGTGSTASGSAGTSQDEIVLGGAFTTVAGSARNHAARLVYQAPASGSGAGSLVLDATYNPNTDGTVTTVAFDLTGKSYLGGSFDMVGGLVRSGIARLIATGQANQVITTNKDLNAFTWTLGGEVPEINSVIFQVSPDGVNFTTVGTGTRLGASNSWAISGVTTVPNGDFYVNALADAETTQFGSQSEVLYTQHFYGTPIPTFQSAAAVSAETNASFSYEVAATNSPTSFSATGLPPGLTLNSALGIISGTPTQSGTYVVTLTITNPTDSIKQQITITVAPTLGGTVVAPTARLINLSTRATVSTSSTLTTGFVVGPTGTGSKSLLLRAVGPTLINVPGITTPLSEPRARLYEQASNQLILSAQGWDNSQTMRNITASVGAFPLLGGSMDTSFATDLPPGSYSMIVDSGNGDTGTALAEIYDADLNYQDLPQRLQNISSQGLVDSGDNLYGGFVIGGTGSKTLLIRAIGPGLGAFGVAAPLPDPVLNVFDSKGNNLAKNSEWDVPTTLNSLYPPASAATINQDDANTGAFALTAGQTDDAVQITLPPGAYTVVITTAGGNSGTAQVEIWEIPGS